MVNVTRRQALTTIGAMGLGGLAGCSAVGGGDDTFKAAFIYDGRVQDHGWTYRHDEGRKKIDEKYDWLATSFTEEVPPNNFERTANNYLNQGHDVIFGTTFGYMDPMAKVAEENPDKYFQNAVGVKTRENMGRYDAHFEEGRYFAGVAAGLLTETNTLGFVGGNPIAFSLRDLNAFTIGARSVNEDVTVVPRWLNTWHDPPRSKQAVRALVDEDVDVVAEMMDSAAANKAANEEDVWTSGVYSSLCRELGGEDYLTSAVVHWDPFYDQVLSNIHNDEFEAGFYWGGMQDDVIQLDEWGPEVPSDVKSEVENQKEAYLNGDFGIWDGTKFEGESDSFLYGEMSSYVEGVEGEAPG